jgi:predicted anti-sigma-YlaC factor YlaD
MNCTEIQFKSSESIDGELMGAEETQLRGHLEICPKCSVVYQDLKSIKHMASGLDSLEPSDQVWASVKSSLMVECLTR